MNEINDIFTEYRPLILGVFGLMILAEIAWSRLRRRSVYNAKESAANVAILVGIQLTKFVLLGWQLYWISLVYEWTPLRIPVTAGSLVLAVVFVDFLYYWHHRALHEIKFFWAFHLVHHSSPWMNFTTSFRLNWLAPIIGPFFYLPAALLGFHPAQVMTFFALNLLYQFWLHTEAIPKLGPLEGILNTPSSHRVHHGSNKVYLDKNYGGVLMIWDRMFGTYVAEEEEVRYGVTTGFLGHNPLKLVFGGFVDYFRGKMDYKG